MLPQWSGSLPAGLLSWPARRCQRRRRVGQLQVLQDAADGRCMRRVRQHPPHALALDAGADALLENAAQQSAHVAPRYALTPPRAHHCCRCPSCLLLARPRCFRGLRNRASRWSRRSCSPWAPALAAICVPRAAEQPRRAPGRQQPSLLPVLCGGRSLKRSLGHGGQVNFKESFPSRRPTPYDRAH